jgi:acetolactate synthase I/II/III large subunit
MEQDHSHGRRRFLKGSLVLGTASAMAPAALAQQAGQGGQAKDGAGTKPAGPSAATAHAEAGPVDAHPSMPNGHGGAGAIIRDPGSDYMVDLLRAAGIRYVAAIPGSSFRGVHESLVNHGGNKAPELIVCVHEEISAAIAHGYAKAAGHPMACLVHSTVGLQHASMAIYNAWCDRVPMMVLAGNGLDETHRRPGVEWFHTAADLGAFVRDYVKWDDTPVSLAHYGESFMRAMQITMTPPCDPVLIVCDGDLQEEAIPDRAALPIPKLAEVAPAGGNPAAIGQAADMLVNATQPLIVADRAARTPAGMRALVQLAELLNAPVIDRGGRLNMPTNHYLNHTGRQASLVASADVILGLELTDIWGVVNDVPDIMHRKSVRKARPDARIIGISAGYGAAHGNVQDQQRYLATDLTLEADSETAMPQLIEAIGQRLDEGKRAAIAARKDALADAHKQMRATDAEAAANGWDASPISTARLSMELWNQIRHLDWALVSDTNFASYWPMRLWDFTEHHQYNGGAGGYGIGYGMPASVGAALAHRDAGRISVSIQTDGDMMMLPGSLWTLAHHQIPLLIVMHNNRAWHQETMHLKRMANWRGRGPTNWPVGTTITDPDIDFATLARSMGVWAQGPIDDPAKLSHAIAAALEVVKQGKPALLDILTQPR